MAFKWKHRTRANKKPIRKIGFMFFRASNIQQQTLKRSNIGTAKSNRKNRNKTTAGIEIFLNETPHTSDEQ